MISILVFMAMPFLAFVSFLADHHTTVCPKREEQNVVLRNLPCGSNGHPLRRRDREGGMHGE